MAKEELGRGDMPIVDGSLSFRQDGQFDRLIAISSRMMGYIVLMIVLVGFVLFLTEIF